jgi:Beta-1,3-glucanase
VDHVSGGPYNSLWNICRDLTTQTAADGQPWSSLIVYDSNGSPLRVLSPNNGMVGNPNMFKGYFDGYIQAVWKQYQSAKLTVDTQAQWGVVSGSVDPSSGNFVIDGQTWSMPSTADVLSCCTGPFAGGSQEKLCITPRIAAALNRSTLLSSMKTPDPAGPGSFYK